MKPTVSGISEDVNNVINLLRSQNQNNTCKIIMYFNLVSIVNSHQKNKIYRVMKTVVHLNHNHPKHVHIVIYQWMLVNMSNTLICVRIEPRIVSSVKRHSLSEILIYMKSSVYRIRSNSRLRIRIGIKRSKDHNTIIRLGSNRMIRQKVNRIEEYLIITRIS